MPGEVERQGGRYNTLELSFYDFAGTQPTSFNVAFCLSALQITELALIRALMIYLK
jgi:hypothetical protein